MGRGVTAGCDIVERKITPFRPERAVSRTSPMLCKAHAQTH
jgi:hypothetical protein